MASALVNCECRMTNAEWRIAVTTQNDACHTTRGSDTRPPAAVLEKSGIPASGLHGNGTIWTVAWPDDTVRFRKNGAADGRLTVTGRRLDGNRAVRADLFSTRLLGGDRESETVLSSHS
jgi:hypothetical protein